MSTTTDVLCPHCEAPMDCKYEMGQGKSCTDYWYLAWLDLPDTCPEGCTLSAEDKEHLAERTKRELLLEAS